MRIWSLILAFGITLFQLPMNTVLAQQDSNYFAFTFSGAKGNKTNVLDPFDLRYDDITGKGVVTMAEIAKKHLVNMPEGRRCLNIYTISRHITDHAETTIFIDKGAAKIKDLLGVFLKQLKEMEVPLDYVIDDMEIGFTNWVLDDAMISAIEANPRFENEIKPLLLERDFPIGPEGLGDLYYVKEWRSHPLGYIIWNTVTRNWVVSYYNKYVFETIKEFYPNIKLSNYGDRDSDGVFPISDYQGHKAYKGGSTIKSGTHSSPVCYGSIDQISYPGRQPDGYPYGQFKITAFNNLLNDLILCQDTVLNTPEGKIMPWIALKSWNDYGPCRNFLATDYYQEFVFHLGLLNPDPFLLFDIGGPDETGDVALVSRLLNHLDGITENQIGKPLVTQVTPWSQRYMLTGMDLKDKSIWRITPDLYTKGVSIENFLVSESPLVFKIGNQVVSFPEGSGIINTEEKLSEYGYWVSAPKGALPQEMVDKALTAPGEPVVADNGIPTGYMYQSDSTPVEYMETNENNTRNSIIASSEQSKIEGENPEIKNEIKDHWAQKQLTALVDRGILVGTEKGIEPEKTLTKAEFITMLIRGTGVLEKEYTGGLTYINVGQWYANPIQTAIDNGWVDHENGEIQPNIPLSRQESAFILSRVLGVSHAPEQPFADHDQIDPQMVEGIYGLVRIGIFQGFPDGSFGGKEVLTRAQAAVLIFKALM